MKCSKCKTETENTYALTPYNQQKDLKQYCLKCFEAKHGNFYQVRRLNGSQIEKLQNQTGQTTSEESGGIC